jgi:long-chain acyl-CoA synthetase
VNIYPAEIENCLMTHPDIHDCAVFGIPDPDFGEALCACIKLEDGALLDPAEVQAHVREHLAGYKVPKVVEFLDELPREDSGKIFKRKLKEPYWEGRETRI